MNVDVWKQRFNTENDQILTNEFDDLFPEQIIEKKSEEQNKEYLKNIRLKYLNDFYFSNPGCNCSKRCDYKGINDILKISENEVEKMGYDPHFKIGKCWKFHYCKGVCDEFTQEHGILKCKYTERKFEFTDIGFDKVVNKRGKMFDIPRKSSAKNLIYSKKNVDITLNRRTKREKKKNRLKKFKKKKERKVNLQTTQVKFDVDYVLEMIKLFTFHKSRKESEHSNMNVPFYIFSKKLDNFFRNISLEQLLLSMGLINIHTFAKNKIDKKDYEIIKIFENKLLKLVPGFFRLKMEMEDIINTQKKQYALAYKYLTDECIFKKIIPQFIDLYTILYFDDKWYNDILTGFLTWDEWTEIIEKSLKIWELCKFCGDDRTINSISIVPEDLFVAILDIMSNGFKYNGIYIVDKNLILSQKFYFLRFNKFSSYGIDPKIHKNGIHILESSLNYMCQELGTKFVIDYLKDDDVQF